MRIAPVAITCIATAALALAACEPAPEDGSTLVAEAHESADTAQLTP